MALIPLTTQTKKLLSSLNNLLNFNRQQLTKFLTEQGHPAYRATQLLKWIYQQGQTDFDQMTDLSKAFRAHLKETATITPPTMVQEHLSQDGTCKWLLKLNDANAIETVFIPEDDRGTLCISSQVGCTLNCTFCATGKQGFNRNLTMAEIMGQVWFATQQLKKLGNPKRITNVVLMGMGEPLYNFDNVLSAVDLMRDEFAYGLSKRKVTISTAGVIPVMEKLKIASDCSLAVSLHAPNNELRDVLVPLNKKYPLEKLMALCRDYFKPGSGRRILFEYVMLDNVNDKPEHAYQLVKILKDIPNKVNLIPFNPFPQTQYKRSSRERIDQFSNILHNNGIRVLVRRTRGDDIQAACGQLVGHVEDKTRRSILLKRTAVR